MVNSVHQNNCTTVRYKSIQSYRKSAIYFGLFRPSSGRYSKNTTLANYDMDVQLFIPTIKPDTELPFTLICGGKSQYCRSQQPRCLRRRSTAARLLRSWVRIPPAAWMFVCCECCVLSGRDLCDELITRPEQFYRMWRVVVCEQETSYARRLKPRQRAAKYKSTVGCSTSRKKIIVLLNRIFLVIDFQGC